MLKSYLKIAFRNLFKQKVHAFINIAGLAIGLAVVTLIALYVHQEATADRFHAKFDRIYRLKAGENSNSFPSPVAEILKLNVPELQQVVRLEIFRTKKVTLDYRNNPLIVRNVIFTDQGFFDIFTFNVVAGYIQTALSEPMSLVLTATEAERIFGSENPVGKIINYENKHLLTVTAVIEEVPDNSSLNFNGIISFNSLTSMLGQKPLTSWSYWNYPIYVLLAEQHSRAAIEMKINETLKKNAPEGNKGMEITLLPFKSIYFDASLNDDSRHGNKTALFVFSVVGMFILGIAIINFINLSLATASIRAKEVGVKKVVGSSRRKLIEQFLTESILSCLIAFLCAVSLSNLLMPVFNQITNSNFTPIQLNSIIPWGFLLCGTLGLGILAGLYPAFYLTRFKPVEVLKGETLKGPRGSILKNSLLIFQFAISITLIICTLVISKQMDFIQMKDLGFNKENILYVGYSPEIKSKLEVFKEKLLQNPNILQVAHSGFMPGEEDMQHWTMDIKYKGIKKHGTFVIAPVDAGFLELLEMQMVEGRSFSREMSGDERNTCIINEAVVREMELDQPFETIFPDIGSERKVIGIVKDFSSKSLHYKIQPLAFYYNPDFYSFVSIKIRSDHSENLQQTIEYVKSTWKELSPNFPVEYHFLDQTLDRLYQAEQQFEKLFSYFSLLAIVIACLGLFGLASFTIARRTKEIGIRKVLGASVTNLLFLLSRQFTKWVLLANLIAWPVTWFVMHRWLQYFAYRINMDWWLFFAAGLMALVVALLAMSYQAIKAAHANPVESLRYE